MYIILKPEMLMNFERIDHFLIQEKIKVDSRHLIKDWEKLARGIYQNQYEEDNLFKLKLNAYLVLTNEIFGNKGALFFLGYKGSLLKNLKRLQTLKESFRDKQKREERIKFIIDIQNIDNIDKDQRAYAYYGKHDEIDLRYIHAPSPNLRSYKRELKIFKSEGVLENKITESQWEEIKRIRSFEI